MRMLVQPVRGEPVAVRGEPVAPFVESLSNHKQVNSNSLILKNLPSISTGRTVVLDAG